MTIISAYQEKNGEKVAIDPEQYHADYRKLEKMHEEAKKKTPTWAFFGGVLTIEDRVYQVY